MKRVFVAGGASFDSIIHVERFFPPRAGTVFGHGFTETIGGTGAGKALSLARLGFDTHFHFYAGRDPQGDHIERRLEICGVRCLRADDREGTERHFNIMDAAGDRISVYATYPTFEPVIGPAEKESLVREIGEADYLVLNIINYVRHLVPEARKRGKDVWCDIHDYDGKNPYHDDFIRGADYLFMSSDCMKEGWRDFMRKMMAWGKKLVVCTHGKNGATALASGGNFIEMPARPCEMKDTNGAGDSFFAGFLYAKDRGADLETALRYATVAGSLCVTSAELVHPELSAELLESEYRKTYG